jgi:transposase InsO family protein
MLLAAMAERASWQPSCDDTRDGTARSDERASEVTFSPQFRTQYNEERPHEALDMKTPGALYAGRS